MSRERRLQRGVVLATAGLLVSGWLSAAYSQTIYRVVDDQGRVTFTDNAERGGEAVTLAPLPSAATSSSAPSRTPAARVHPGQPFMPYDRFVISTPSAGTAIRGGMTAVELTVSPALREDHRVQLLVNGELSQSALHSDAFWITGLPKGQHQLQAELLDSRGRVQHRTPSVTITIMAE